MWINNYTLLPISFAVACIATSAYSVERSQMYGTSKQLKEGNGQVEMRGSTSNHRLLGNSKYISSRAMSLLTSHYNLQTTIESIGTTEKIPAGCDTKTISHSGVDVIMDKSGKTTITFPNRNEDESAKNIITVEFDNLEEIDTNGNVIYSYNQTLLASSFTFSEPSEGVYPSTGINVRQIVFQTTMHNGAMLKIYMFLFKEQGTITNDEEMTVVSEGDVKFNVEIKNWLFCTAASNCPNNAIGEYLDLDIVMKGTKRAAESRCKQTYNLGSASVNLSKMIIVDGAMVGMTKGYPMLHNQGCNDQFMFRLPKFSYNVIYDPHVYEFDKII